jgi:hypothetical protein
VEYGFPQSKFAMKQASWVALIFVSAAAAISSLLAAACSLWSSVAIGSAGIRGPLFWHIDFIAIALSVAFAGVSILLLQRPTKPSLLGYKLTVSCVIAALTTAFSALDLSIQTRILVAKAECGRTGSIPVPCIHH